MRFFPAAFSNLGVMPALVIVQRTGLAQFSRKQTPPKDSVVGGFWWRAAGRADPRGPRHKSTYRTVNSDILTQLSPSGTWYEGEGRWIECGLGRGDG